MEDDVSLFEESALGSVSAKLAFAEEMLDLLTRDGKFADFARDVLRAVLKALPSEAGSILELNYKERTLFFRAVEGQSADRVDSFVIPFGQGIVGHVAESRLPMVVNSVEAEQKHLKSISDAVGFPARNLIAVPIEIRGKVFGVIELLNRVGQENYSAEDTEFLTHLVVVAAKAFEVRLMMAWALSQSLKSGKQDAA